MHNHLRFHWHAGNLLAGSAQPGRFRLLKDDLDAVRKKGIKTIISVNGDLTSVPKEFSKGLTFYSEPILDGFPPVEEQMERILRVVRREVNRGRPCLICCRGGVGRTATVLAALMMSLKAVGPMAMDEALKELRSKGRTPMSVEQVDFLSRWSDRVSKKRKTSRKG